MDDLGTLGTSLFGQSHGLVATRPPKEGEAQSYMRTSAIIRNKAEVKPGVFRYDFNSVHSCEVALKFSGSHAIDSRDYPVGTRVSLKPGVCVAGRVTISAEEIPEGELMDARSG